jgi:hypothetical protein
MGSVQREEGSERSIGLSDGEREMEGLHELLLQQSQERPASPEQETMELEAEETTAEEAPAEEPDKTMLPRQQDVQHDNEKEAAVQSKVMALPSGKQINVIFIFRKPRARKPKSMACNDGYAQWLVRQRNNINNMVTYYYGEDWAKKYKRPGEQPWPGSDKASCTPDDVLAVFVAFFKRHPALFSNISQHINVNVAKAVEMGAIQAVQSHLFSVAMCISAHLGLTKRKWQALVNYTGNKVDEDGNWEDLRAPHGTPIAPLFPGVGYINTEKKKFVQGQGMEVGDGKVYMSPLKVVAARLAWLWETSRIELNDGVIISVQVLGDATQIWKALEQNGTLVCVKVLYKTAEAFKTKSGAAKEKETTQALEHLRAIGFYLGDDCKEDILAALPDMVEDLEKLQREGWRSAEQARTPSKRQCGLRVQLFLGGDLKFIVAMMGLASCSSHCPCPWCLVVDGQLHLTFAQLDALGVGIRTHALLMMCAHLPPLPKADGTPCEPYTCTANGEVSKAKTKYLPARWEPLGPCNATITPSTVAEERNEAGRKRWQQQHYGALE